MPAVGPQNTAGVSARPQQTEMSPCIVPVLLPLFPMLEMMKSPIFPSFSHLSCVENATESLDRKV